MTIWDTWAGIKGFDQVQKSAGYLRATPLFQSHIHDILYKYGIDPNGDQLAMAGGPIENNPYSVVSMLKRGRTEADHASMNDANNAGLEESGAAVGALNANNENYKKNYAGAVGEAGGLISGELGNYSDTINSLFDDAEKNPVGAPVAAPLGGPGLTNTPVTSSGGLGSAPGADIGGAKAAAAARSVSSKLKPKVIVGPQNKGLPGYM